MTLGVNNSPIMERNLNLRENKKLIKIYGSEIWKMDQANICLSERKVKSKYLVKRI